MFIAVDEWKPQGIEGMESKALYVVKNVNLNQVVIAGPGAGKTELLAQKACFLLQTGTCPPPYRILAISFKRDAAKNLKNRVALRCKEFADRFDSYTFDGFAKNVLDRFIVTLPTSYKPEHAYEIKTDLFYDKALERLLEGLSDGEDDWRQINRKTFEEKLALYPISQNFGETDNKYIKKIWDFLLSQTPSLVTYSMVMRLAEYIIRQNPLIKNIIQQTYQYVFIDEFQDTTPRQYDLVKACFLSSNSKFTSVGDPKQGIMKWAGADKEIFEKFYSDFNVDKPIYLIFNYRSAPLLVNIQHKIICHLEGCIVEEVVAQQNINGECRALIFDSYENEAEYLAELIHKYIIEEEIVPREICILARVRVGEYTDYLRKELSNKGIKSRDESLLQDLLSEPATDLILAVLKLVAACKSPKSYSFVVNYLEQFHNNTNNRELEEIISKNIKEIQDIEDMEAIFEKTIEFLNLENIKQWEPKYKRGTSLNELISEIKKYLISYDLPLKEAIYEFEGTDSVPIMTIHKSKGLEYHTVIFIGLEDNAFWNYKNNPTEEQSNVFVAFSRAKQRVIMTTSKVVIKYGRKVTANNIEKIEEILLAAGITQEIA